MPNTHENRMCEHLAQLLSVGADNGDSDFTAQAIAKHMATCPACALDEQALDTLLARYRQAEQSPLSADLEQRLLDYLCGVHAEESPDAEPTS